MAETLGGFRELTGAVSCKPGYIALGEVCIDLADGIALSWEPSRKVFSGPKVELDTTGCISFLA
jgi:hypothetical protein